MASVIRERRGERWRYRIQFRDADKRRRSIRLGGVNRKDAEHVASHVQSLVGARISGRPLDTATAAWLANIGDDLRNKLADAGLAERRASATLGAFISEYVANRTEAAANTKRSWLNTQAKLVVFFGEVRDLRSITP